MAIPIQIFSHLIVLVSQVAFSSSHITSLIMASTNNILFVAKFTSRQSSRRLSSFQTTNPRPFQIKSFVNLKSRIENTLHDHEENRFTIHRNRMAAKKACHESIWIVLDESKQVEVRRLLCTQLADGKDSTYV